MIGQLTGKVISLQAPLVILDVNGVGYEINVPLTTVFQLATSENRRLFTHLVVRDDAHSLYGFLSADDRDWFRTLIKVNGVGPRMALAILSGLSAQQLATTIDLEHVSVLQKIPGVGKKTAERLIIELQDKCRKWLANAGPADYGMVSNKPGGTAESVAEQVHPEQDAQYALIALGYKPADASRVIRKVLSPEATSEQLIKRALQEMVRA